jgi:hypothetical protein
MNRRTRRLAGGAAALGAGAILIGPITALAQSDDDPPASTSPAATDDPSETPADERPDVASRLVEVLQPLVDAGTITQAQLDAVSQALQDAGPMWGGGHGGPRGDHGRGPGRFGGRLSLTTAAETIGIPADELRAALEDGQTLAEVATANGVEPQAVIDALVADVTTRLDEAVADGRIDQADADARLAELTERITTAVEEGFPARDGAGREAPDEQAADDEPSTSEAPTTTPADG